MKKTARPGCIQENIDNIIENQETGKCPIEYTNQLSRAKIFEMKGINTTRNRAVKNFNGLYKE